MGLTTPHIRLLRGRQDGAIGFVLIYLCLSTLSLGQTTDNDYRTGLPKDEIDIERTLAQLKEGQVSVLIPAKMKVGQTERVRLRVTTRSSNSPSSTSSQIDPEQQHIKVVKVSSIMRARLDGEGFKIVQLTDPEQTVDGTAEWDWNVTPTTVGNYPLLMSLSVIVAAPGGGVKEFPMQVRDLPVIITVERNWLLSFSHVSGVAFVAILCSFTGIIVASKTFMRAGVNAGQSFARRLFKIGALLTENVANVNTRKRPANPGGGDG